MFFKYKIKPRKQPRRELNLAESSGQGCQALDQKSKALIK